MSALLRKAGIISSAALGIIFSMTAACLAFSAFWPEKDLNSLNLFSNIWLIKIFKLQAELFVNQDSLSGINWFDVFILILFILTCLSLFERARYSYKVWFLIASSVLILGITVFIVTKLAGRSSFMASGLIISSIFFTGHFRNKLTAFTGILANVFLLTGDFSVGADIRIFTILFAAGYILLIIWIFLITKTLLKQSEIPYTSPLPPISPGIRPE
jgi:hypothetical protein